MKLLKNFIQYLAVRFYAFLQRQERYQQYRIMLEKGALQVGKYTYGIPAIHFYKGSERNVIIGNFCSISPGVVMITGGIHPADWVSTFPFRIKWQLSGAFSDGMPSSKGDIVIGSDVWIGTEAMILSGITIGHGAIIAARSVVTTDIPPYAMVAGIPAKVVRFRFEPLAIERLLKIRWWDWDDEKIKAAVPLLSGSNLDDFLRAYG